MLSGLDIHITCHWNLGSTQSSLWLFKAVYAQLLQGLGWGSSLRSLNPLGRLGRPWCLSAWRQRAGQHYRGARHSVALSTRNWDHPSRLSHLTLPLPLPSAPRIPQPLPRPVQRGRAPGHLPALGPEVTSLLCLQLCCTVY